MTLFAAWTGLVCTPLYIHIWRSQESRVSFLAQVTSPCWDKQEVSAPLCVNLLSSPWLKTAALPSPGHPPLFQLREMSVCLWLIKVLFWVIFNLMSVFCEKNKLNLSFGLYKWRGKFYGGKWKLSRQAGWKNRNMKLVILLKGLHEFLSKDKWMYLSC